MIHHFFTKVFLLIIPVLVVSSTLTDNGPYNHLKHLAFVPENTGNEINIINNINLSFFLLNKNKIISI